MPVAVRSRFYTPGFTHVEVDIEILDVDLAVWSKRDAVNTKKSLCIMR